MTQIKSVNSLYYSLSYVANNICLQLNLNDFNELVDFIQGQANYLFAHYKAEHYPYKYQKEIPKILPKYQTRLQYNYYAYTDCIKTGLHIVLKKNVLLFSLE